MSRTVERIAPIPVDSFTRNRARPTRRGPVPAAGARWGLASRFDFDFMPRPDESGGGLEVTNVRAVASEVVFSGEETHREFSVAEVDLSGTILDVEGTRSVTFYLGDRQVLHEERNVQGNLTTIQPTVETVKEYLKFHFEVIPEVGARGEPHPRETEETDWESLYGG